MTDSHAKRRRTVAASTTYVVAASLGAILLSLPARAQISCGDVAKEVPLAVREELKGDVEGKAQLLTKLVGDAQLKGKIETSRTELHQEHKNLDQNQVDIDY